MNKDIEKICVSEEEIKEMTSRLGKKISKDYEGREPMLIGLLKGCAPFMMDLIKNITVDCTIDFLRVKSYSGESSTGVVRIIGELPVVKDKDVIIVDDILDTGRTINEIKRIFMDSGARSFKVCVMLNKPEGRKVNIEADYCGGTVPNAFVVGYGLDYNEKYRNLPYIGVLKEEVYKK